MMHADTTGRAGYSVVRLPLQRLLRQLRVPADEAEGFLCCTFMSSEPCTGFAFSLSLPTKNEQVLSMPRLMLMGLAPLVTAWRPKWMISRASTDAVVVPSPALSFVRPATCANGLL